MRSDDLLCFLLPLTIAFCGVSCRYDETYNVARLLNRIFVEGGYNKEIRPVENSSTPIFISIGITLMQLLFVDERSQVMKTNVWIQTAWSDYRLAWDPTEFGGITSIRIRSKNVWRPDIVLMNNADGKYEPGYEPNVVLYHYGTVLYIPPAIYKSSCEIDVEFFPFDEQRCELKLASWTYSADEIQYGWYEKRDRAVMQDYMVSGTWDVVSFPGRIENASMHGARSIRTVVFTLTIRRKTLFFTVNLIIPCIMLAFLCASVFFLPSDAGEKITLSLSLLFSINVFLLLVFKMLPATGKQVPLISKYLIFTSAMNITSIVGTVINNNINFRTRLTHYMPRWTRMLFVVQLPKLLFMKCPQPVFDHEQESFLQRRQFEQSETSTNRCAQPFPRAGNTVSPTISVLSRWNNRGQLRDAVGNGGFCCQCVSSDYSEAQKLVESVIYIAEHRRIFEQNKQIRCEWKFIAAVIDRILLIAYILVITFVAFATFLTPPDIIESLDQMTLL